MIVSVLRRIGVNERDYLSLSPSEPLLFLLLEDFRVAELGLRTTSHALVATDQPHNQRSDRYQATTKDEPRR